MTKLSSHVSGSDRPPLSPTPAPLLVTGTGASSLLCWGGHLVEALLVNPEEPPALLQREVGSTATLVELYRRLVVLGNDEVHAAAASFHRRLERI